ncbi:2-C-methyl-D-erythritol 4-phosphate cytidylyltransferase, putative [Pediculus humanus corporis]|uniref:2-C-methyl-D-erythritol 4-phosphate cytidylyltransferase, putative n=1 Tax=Pediculus humanus subsp. corporis TaxID=121224 RepID=E0VR29_PEDHC|nr:2-C-methyl-D-erythritol 4-phosphate cytidylyltransferase, putative [Pediculus humanus corporis]EEB15835.1 2-C-methyl-D-erythritol 4-phosphate cytidylyltransferase, putative [Pediculus humanus corporis]
MFDFDVAVVVPMAGCSERFPSSCQKQYYNILGKPLFLYCVEKFYKFNYIKKICLVCDKIDFVEDILKKNFSGLEKFLIVKGGASRHISIKNGLTQLSKYGNIFKVVVIHDGVRPFICEEFLCKIISQSALHGAAGATRPLISTIIKPNEEEFVESCLIRNEYIRSETPQAFLFHIIFNAYEKCNEYDLINGTECLQLALKYSQVKAKLIPGPDTLWKNKVNQIDYFSPGININPTKYFYNNIVYFSNEKIEESHLILLKTLFDNNNSSETNSDSMDSSSIIERTKTEKIIEKLYDALKKEKEKKLMDLIISLIFLEKQTLAGQILFV